VLLYQLGYVERQDLGTVVSFGPIRSIIEANEKKKHGMWLNSLFSGKKPEVPVPRSTLKICVLGDNGVGKSSFVWYLSDLRAPGMHGGGMEVGVEYSKFSDALVVGGCGMRLADAAGMYGTTSSSSIQQEKRLRQQQQQQHSHQQSSVLTDPFHLSVTSVPLDLVEKWKETCVASCDLVVLMFQPTNSITFDTAIELSRSLPATMPRILISSKSDLVHLPPQSDSSALLGGSSLSSLKSTNNKVLKKATDYVHSSSLPPIAQVSTLTGEGMVDAIALIIDVAVEPRKAIPRKRSVNSWGSLFTPEFTLFAVAGSAGALVWLMMRYNKELELRWSQMIGSVCTFVNSIEWPTFFFSRRSLGSGSGPSERN
jgi:hypothetical protein